MKVAVFQFNPIMGDFEYNARAIKKAIALAKKRRVDLFVCPELSLTGYPPEDLLLKPHFVLQNLKALKQIQNASRGITIICGFVDRDAKGNLYNAAAILQGGHKRGVYHKLALPNYGVFDEKRYFSKGTQPLTLEFKGGERIGVSICEDIWTPTEQALKAFRNEGLNLLINLSASPFHHGKQSERLKILSHAAKRLKTHVLYCNMVGGQDELIFDGRSCLTSPRGALLQKLESFDEDLGVFVIGNEKRSSSKNSRLTQVIQIPVRLSRTKKTKKMSARLLKDITGSDEVIEALTLGIRDYVSKNRFRNVVLGLSGGVDSALVAALAVRALGREHVLAVTMPSDFTSHGTLSDAKQLAQNLKIPCHEIPIRPLHQTYLQTLRPFFKGQAQGIAEENIQARIRGNLLMALSNKFGYLVLTTGNKSEMATGYCTLYGDMAGGFAVIKDVPKTMVYQLCRRWNEIHRKTLIPKSILRREPTAELRPDQRDQDSLPPYSVLDRVLQHYVEGDRAANDIIQRGFSGKVVRDVIRRVDRNEYKRRQGPIGIKITPKAFGRDRRMPITNRY